MRPSDAPQTYNPLTVSYCEAQTMTPDDLAKLRADIDGGSSLKPDAANLVLSQLLAGSISPDAAMKQLDRLCLRGPRTRNRPFPRRCRTAAKPCRTRAAISICGSGFEDSTGRQVGSGLGSMLTILGVSMLGGPVTSAAVAGSMGAVKQQATRAGLAHPKTIRRLRPFYGILPV